MDKTKDELKAEFVRNKKVLDKVKNEVVKLMKSAEKDKKSYSGDMAKIHEIIERKRELVDEQKGIIRELVFMGEDKTQYMEGDLFELVKDGNCTAIAGALLDGVDIDRKDKDSWTPLHVAALNGHQRIAAFLLQMGAKSDTKNSLGRTPFHVAVSHDHAEVTEIFLKRGVNPFEKTKDKQYPMDLAASPGMTALLGKHEQEFIKKNIHDFEKVKEACDSILIYTVTQKFHSILPLLVEAHKNGEDIRVNDKDGKGNTALHLAVINGDKKSLKLLLECKPYPFIKNTDGKYPMDLVEPESPKIKEIMAEYEDEYIQKIAGNVEFLNQMGNEFLLYCAEKGYVDAVRELLRYVNDGLIDIDTCDDNEDTALHLAVKYRRDDMAALLLRSGAEMLVINKKGLMPADYINIEKNPKLVRVFNNFERIWVRKILQSVSAKKEK
ncbi:MAG: ankyrin repeat domain-containing protein [bacterium]|nr:ankyrin repeat domain-containing protein [bacterium]